MHLGIAVALGDDGLIVPVVRNAHELSHEGLANRIADLAERARSKRLEPDEVGGGTFTITNPGRYGALLATPIINQPQVATPTSNQTNRPVDRRQEQDSIYLSHKTILISHKRRPRPGRGTGGPLTLPRRGQPTKSAAHELWVVALGQVPYRDALALQEQLREAPPGRRDPRRAAAARAPARLHARPAHRAGRPADGRVVVPSQGIDVADSDRGGRVTYHGPGQLVGYPIMRVRDVPAYVHTMESAIVGALADEGIDAEVREGLTGVWAGEAKIGSIGVHVSRGVTTHGFAVNVDGDLQPFEWIVPCGLDHVRMTSVLKETGRTGAMPCFRKRAAWRFAQAFGRRQRLVSPARLESRTAPHAELVPA